MPKNKTTMPNNAYETRWVRCDLDESQKNAVKALKTPLKNLFDSLAALIDDRYKITFSWDERSEAYTVFMTAPRITGQAYSVCLSARAPDMESALRVLLFKHHELLGGNWSGETTGGGNKDPWG